MCLNTKTKPRQSQERPLGFAILSNVGRVLRKFRVRPAFRPVRKLAQIFKKPKDRPTIVYKVSCHDCAFIYVGESDHLWSSRGAEHDPGRASNTESVIKQHAESTDHNIHPREAQILKRSVTNYNKRLFLPFSYR